MHPTLDQLHQLGLAGMARAFAELEANPTSASLSHAEWLGLLLDREATERYERRLLARLRYARLRHQAAVENVDYRAARGLDRTGFQALIAVTPNASGCHRYGRPESSYNHRLWDGWAPKQAESTPRRSASRKIIL